jgi:competence protein ComEA
VVDINSADAATLEALPGVGPVLAARIVAHRDSAGHFASPDDLLAVRGIGPSTLARFRHLVRVGR